MRPIFPLVCLLAGCGMVLLPACNCGSPLPGNDAGMDAGTDGGGLQSIKHIVIIMQENRSFDHYFGTYPGADGIPIDDAGTPIPCLGLPDGGCVRPFHDTNDVNAGGSHGQYDAIHCIDNGLMDGFLAGQGGGHGQGGGGAAWDVMGYHTDQEIPNYWAYAQSFVLQDRMFQPNQSWSLPAHLYMVSEWSARCVPDGGPMSCVSNIDLSIDEVPTHRFQWTDLTYLLHKAGVSWKYYLGQGDEPDCEDGSDTCPPVQLGVAVPSIWNPLVSFDTVAEDGETGNIVPSDQFLVDAKNGTLPAVSWIVPAGNVSEHPLAGIKEGQGYVTSLVNAVMQGPNWSSTAIFIAWDDWGGFYDHVAPPHLADGLGYGLRVPGLMISPYAKRGYIDHQTLSFDAYAKFIEDVFLGGQRLDPTNDGRPDSRPAVRENEAVLGDLREDFDFTQSPRAPLILRSDAGF